MADDLIKKIPVVSATANDFQDVKTAPSDGEQDPFEDVKKEIASRFALLPDDIKQVIMDDGYQMKLFTIAKDLKLTYDELGVIELETTMVLLGMTKPADFRDEIQLQLKKNDPEIDAIVREINNDVFNPIRASIDNLFTNKKELGDYANTNVLKNVPGALGTLPPTPPVTVAPVAQPVQTQPQPTILKTTPQPMAPQSAPSLSAQEKGVLESSGVVIHETTPIAKAPEVATPKIVSALAPTMSASKVTDYSIVKPIAPSTQAQPQTVKSTTDPYREPLN